MAPILCIWRLNGDTKSLIKERRDVVAERTGGEDVSRSLFSMDGEARRRTEEYDPREFD